MSTVPYSSALVDRLHGIRRKARVYALAFGAGLVVAIAAGLLLVLVLLDWTLNLPSVPRIVLLVAALGAFAAATFNWLLRPLIAKVSISDFAGRLEEAFPEFDDRLRSSVNFTGAAIPGSEPMQRRVVDQANAMASKVDLGSAVVAKPAVFSVLGALGAIGLIVLLGAIAGPNFLRTAGNRLMMGGAKWPKSVQISMMNALPTRVPVGKPVDVKMRLTKGDTKAKKAIIHYRFDANGPWQKEYMTRADDGSYTASIETRLKNEEARGKLEVRVESGDDEVEIAPIAIVPRLDIASIEAAVLPPAYARTGDIKASTVNLHDRPAVMAVGSDVALKIGFNKPLAKDQQVSIEPTKPGQKIPAMKWDRDGSALATGHFSAHEPIRFVVRAIDEDGFQNTGTDEYELIVREDALPTIQIDEPRRSEECTPIATFPLKATAEDDYGISRLQLVVKRINSVDRKIDPAADLSKNAPDGKNDWTVDLVNGTTIAPQTSWSPVDGASSDRRRFRLEYQWALESLADAKLKPGDVLEYFVQAKDNFSLDGKTHDWVPSGKLRINIVSAEQKENSIRAVAEQVQKQIAQVKSNVNSTKNETESLQQHATKSEKFDQGDQKQAERLANEQATAAQQTKQISTKLADVLKELQQNKVGDKTLQPQIDQAGKQLEKTSEGALKEASKDLNNAKDNKANPGASKEQQKQNAEQRAAELAKAQQNQDQASKELQQAMDKLGDFNPLETAMQKLQEIKDAQKKLGDEFQKEAQPNLGKKAEELDKKTQDKMAEMSQQQKKLGEQLDNAIKEMTKKSEQMQKSDPQSSEAMKKSAQTGQQQGLPQKQQQASEQMKQNQQAGAQNAQKQVEIGIEMMMKELKEAQRRKLEALAAKLAALQQQVQELVRRQSGHNIDNLTLDDVKKLQAMSNEEREELMGLAQRDDKNAPPPPTIQQLSGGQVQTEQNTRDIAKSAESLPDSAPAAKLTQAAGQMERAIVSLRNNNLPEAYDPSQVEALRALREALAKVDEAKKKANDELQQQDQETIRQAYVKLLDAQRKLDKSVVDIDAAPKGEDGKPKDREMQVALGKLPTTQGDHAETAGKLGTELEKIGSIVYKWANEDLVKTMKEVKDDLAKPETGKPVQSEQTRIEEQLLAMIESLQEIPKKGEYGTPPSKGGSGKGQPKTQMPSEVELRLLKGLQQAVNKSTKTISGEEKKDEKKLFTLGGRQGELRNLLDQMLRKAPGGKGLGAEPDKNDQLPEEASKEDVDNQEFQKGLLGGDLTDDTVTNTIKLTGDRMARSRVRLADNNDPGKVTQLIQDRIVLDLDNMIDLARKQMSNSPPKPGSGKPGEKPGPPKPGQGEGPQQAGKGDKPGEGQGKKPGQQTGGSQAAADSSLNPGGNHDADLSADLKEKFAEWGSLTPRQREAVIEGKGEITIEKYRKIVDDYYRELAKKAKQP